MDFIDAHPLETCLRGGERRVWMASEYNLSRDVVPIFQVFTVDSVKPATEAEEKSPVMDVRGLEEQQPKQEPKQEPEEAKVEAKEFASEKLPYLSVLRNEVGESARYLDIHI